MLRCLSNETTYSQVFSNGGDHNDFVCFDNNGTMYANAHNAHHVRQYSAGAASGTIIAGTGSSVTGTLNKPIGTAIDDFFNLYIAEKDDNEISMLASGSSNLVSVINTNGVVSSLSALLLPHGTANEIYMSDAGGTAVFLWTFGAAAPSANYTNVIDGTTLDKPRGIKLDPYGNLYVADQDNDRIVVFCANSTTGLVLLDSPGKPIDLAFDSNMNLHVLLDNGTLFKHALM